MQSQKQDSTEPPTEKNSNQTQHTVFFQKTHGAHICCRQWGKPQKKRNPVVLLHGFTHTGETWEEISRALAAHRQVFAPDLRGHGDTTTADGRFGFAAILEDLLSLEAQHITGKIHLVGYSMGGRAAAYSVLADPQHWSSLSLLSASPGIALAAARAARAKNDDNLSARLRHEGIDAFATFWENLPLFAGLQKSPPATKVLLHRVRRRHDPEQLAAGLQQMSPGRQADRSRQLATLSLPLLLVAGDQDEKYRDSTRRLSAMRSAELSPSSQNQTPPGPTTTTHILPGIGHSVHLEAPTAIASILETFFRAQDNLCPEDPQGTTSAPDFPTPATNLPRPDQTRPGQPHSPDPGQAIPATRPQRPAGRNCDTTTEQGSATSQRGAFTPQKRSGNNK